MVRCVENRETSRLEVWVRSDDGLLGLPVLLCVGFHVFRGRSADLDGPVESGDLWGDMQVVAV